MAKLFLSHAWADKDPLQELRRALEARGLACWEDCRELRAGDVLLLEKHVREARGFVVLVTPEALQSEWVQRECRWAAEQAQLSGGTYRLVAVANGVTPAAVNLLLGPGERLFVKVDDDPLDAVPRIVEAFSGAPLSGAVPRLAPPPPPREELVLRFTDPRWEEAGGRRRVRADFEVEHLPAGGGARARRRLGAFESPLGPIELGELQWYLEVLPAWASHENLVKGRAVEGKLAAWGEALFAATLGKDGPGSGRFFAAEGQRRITVEVEPTLSDDEAHRGAAAAVLALPWELLRHDGRWLAAGRAPIGVARRLPRAVSMPPVTLAHRLRVLLVVARTDDAGFIDARASLTPLVEALRPLGHKVEVDVLPDGTLPALQDALRAAAHAGRPYQVVHFDGHGVYDAQRGLGLLVFEHPDDAGKLERRSARVDAETLGAVLQEHRVPLFVLEACQTAQSTQQVESSVAGRLLRAGVASVVAMSHSVLVETARRFVGPFYTALAEGQRVSAALLRGQQALFADPRRNRPGEADWTLVDWFVPLLFQDDVADVPLLPRGPLPDPDDLDRAWARRVAETPELPRHGFVGRAREVLALHRLLHRERAVALVGVGGQGKTALAIEAARWLLAIGRFERLAWVSVELHGDARVVVDALGRQLVAGWTGVAAVEGPGGDLGPAVALVERALGEWRCLVVVDNLESVLGDPDPALVPLLARLARAGESRLLLTSRESPPEALGATGLRIGPLSFDEGRRLVSGVLQAAGVPVPGDGDGINRLVETVRGHPRSLVLLAPRVAELGLRGVVEDLGPLLAELERRHPGQRENSLLASVRLGLDRLPEELRRPARALCVFRGAAHASVLAQVAQVEVEEALRVGGALMALGLADAEGSFLLFEPSLPAALGLGVTADERVDFAARWREATAELAEVLYEQRPTDAQFASTGTRVALEELLAVVDALGVAVEAGDLAVEAAHRVTTRVESLVETLGRPRVLDRVVAARRQLGARLGDWSHARFEHDRAEVERRLGNGDVAGALAGAQALLARAEAAGEAYPGADYDGAMACVLLGRVLRTGGRAEAAVPLLEEARRRFEDKEARTPGCGAARMASVCITLRADALRAAGRFDEAAAGTAEAIALGEAAGRPRDVAVGKGQLGTVRMLQGRYDEALAAYREARATFESLGEPGSVAVMWHQEAMVHRRAGNPTAAERAYLTSLDLKTRLGDLPGQASTLNELGNLYDGLGRMEQAADFYRRAGETYRTLGDDRFRAFTLNNIAATLRKLGRLDEARTAIAAAIRLKAAFGPAAEPWTSHAILADIETAAGDPASASAARAEAIRLYRTYRDAGGSPQTATGRLVEQVHRAVTAGTSPAQLVLQLPPAERFADDLHTLRAALVSLLLGQPTGFDDPRVSYTNTAELLRLRDALAARA